MVLRNVPITYTLDQQRQEINNLATDFNAVEVVFNNTQWDTAYGWGDHASAGYLTTLPTHTHTFADLSDTPNTLTASKWLKVNASGDGIVETDAPPDIDIHLNQFNPTSGYVLSWNGSAYVWVPQTTVYNNQKVDTHLNQSNPTSGHVLSWDGSDYEWVAQTGGGGGSTTINNNADNRLITGSGTANTLEAESGLTYDGSTLTIDGTATFTGEIGIGPNSTNATTNASGIWLSDLGRTTFYHSSSESGNYLTFTQADGSGGSSELASISGTGAATFGALTISGSAGPLDVGSALNSGDGVNIYSGGSIYIRQTGTGVANKLLILQNNNSAEVANLNGAGGATFSDDVNGNGGFTGKRTNDAYHVFRGQNSGGTQTSLITGAGNLTLSSYINCGTQVYAGAKYANGTGVLLNGDNGDGGEVNVRNDTGSLRVWSGMTGGNTAGDITSEILATGNAKFGKINTGSVDGFGVELDIAANAGTLISQCINVASQYTEHYAGWYGTNKYSYILANGLAMFAGGVRVGGSDVSNTMEEYEEGTFTPSFDTFSSASTVSYQDQSGRYTKIGDVVYFSVKVLCTVSSWGNGEWKITGLPFPCWSGYNNPPVMSAKVSWREAGGTYVYKEMYKDFRADHWWNQPQVFFVDTSNQGDWRPTTATDLQWINVTMHGVYLIN